MLKIYSTQHRKKVDFKPVHEGKIGMYVCGPTVYNRIHIGNARTFLSFDIIRRYLEWSGYDVTFVQNVTDVDDKIINRAAEENTTAAEIAKKYTDLFIEDMHAAGVKDPDIRPKATEEIDAMIELVQSLVDKGHAYVEDGDVYFDVRSFKGYGSLSGRDVEDAESGHRELQADGQGLEERKHAEADFALWKAAKPGEPSWDSPWGPGRPGWHIECSAMSHKYLGLPFDIHGGGSDLVFPHHENERAQSMCGYENDFANYWMHAGMLQVANDESGKNEKMSKSLNNFVLLYEALEQVKPNVLRMLVLQTHYRSPLVFGEKRLSEAQSALTRIETAIKNIDWKLQNQSDKSEIDTKAIDDACTKAKEKFTEAMDDDFNTSLALAEIFELVGVINTEIGKSEINKDTAPAIEKAKALITELMGVFGIEFSADEKDSGEFEALAEKLGIEIKGDAEKSILDERSEARANKNFELADKIRDTLAEAGYTIEDTPQGSRIV